MKSTLYLCAAGETFPEIRAAALDCLAKAEAAFAAGHPAPNAMDPRAGWDFEIERDSTLPPALANLISRKPAWAKMNALEMIGTKFRNRASGDVYIACAVAGYCCLVSIKEGTTWNTLGGEPTLRDLIGADRLGEFEMIEPDHRDA